jgi:sodium/potassium/calcium exchanger 6
VPLNGWRMDRKIGIGLICLWALSTTGNVIVEVFWTKDRSLDCMG